MAVEKSANLDGYFKEVYDSLENSTASFAILQKDIKFVEQKRLGDNFNFPVKLRHSHGFTVAGSADVGTAFDLDSPISLLMKNAQVDAATIVGQEDIPYDVISRAQAGGAAAFGDAMDEIVFGLREGHHFHLEMHLMHGGQNIGVIAGSPSGSGGSRTITIGVASWAPGIWAMGEGMAIDVYNAAGDTLRNDVGPVTVGAVDFVNRTAVVSGDSTDMTALADTDIIVPRGCQGAWTPGLRQLCNDTSTTIHNIAPATYALWKPNATTVSSVKASMAVIQNVLTASMIRGLDEKVTALCSPYTWSDLNNDLAALRRYTNDMRAEASLGTKSIQFHGVTGAEVELKPHPMAKTGDLLTYPPKRLRRIGSSDVTNKIRPGGKHSHENFYQELESKAACRIRTYSNCALAAKQRARLGAVTGIVPTAFA